MAVDGRGENEVEYEHQPNEKLAIHLDPIPLISAPADGIGQTQGYKVTHAMEPRIIGGLRC